MAEAALWGFVAGASLLVGAAIALIRAPSAKMLGFIMAFGAGVLISALAFELTDEAFSRAGADAVAIGLTLGALTYFALNTLLDRAGGAHRKSSGGEQANGAPMAILRGAVLDGIPESAAIGLTLLTGEGVSVALVVRCSSQTCPKRSLRRRASRRRACRRPGASRCGPASPWSLRCPPPWATWYSTAPRPTRWERSSPSPQVRSS